ncbi:hypothetical protein CMI46_00830 [Candidatus Pacearchaeota archaeon]|nr:hypothetical protein [Candidatus Pacearchaeota archaeon]
MKKSLIFISLLVGILMITFVSVGLFNGINGFTGNAIWGWSHCTSSNPCPAGEGDCDRNSDCLTNYCHHNVGQSYGKSYSMDVCESKEDYIDAFDNKKIQSNIEETNLYGKYIYLGNLAPFPTKTSQSYWKLKRYGIVDSNQANLKGFYLQQGSQTRLTSIVRNNANNIQTGSTTEQTVKNIMNWIYDNLDCQNQDPSQYKIRERTAHDIILSKCANGCTDNAIVFAALARAKGISATVTETVREKWIAEMVWANKWKTPKEGHFFSEVYLPEDNKWVVVDVVGHKLTGRDGEGYYVSGLDGHRKFMLFERGLDSWDYGIKTNGVEFDTIVRNKYYVEVGDQP